LTTVVVLPTPPFWLAQAMIWPNQVPISIGGTLNSSIRGRPSGWTESPDSGPRRPIPETAGPRRDASKIGPAAYGGIACDQPVGRRRVRRCAGAAELPRGRLPRGSSVHHVWYRLAPCAGGPPLPANGPGHHPPVSGEPVGACFTCNRGSEQG
jgi:hypothetical protein